MPLALREAADVFQHAAVDAVDQQVRPGRPVDLRPERKLVPGAALEARPGPLPERARQSAPFTSTPPSGFSSLRVSPTSPTSPTCAVRTRSRALSATVKPKPNNRNPLTVSSEISHHACATLCPSCDVRAWGAHRRRRFYRIRSKSMQGTEFDELAFFRAIAGDICATCGSPDFNGDGDSGTDADIEAFFRVMAGGPC